MAFERVHAVLLFWDWARAGIAEYRGQLHHYEPEWDEAADDYAATYVLTPIGEETLALALERDQIYSDWWRAFRRGDATHSTNPTVEGQNQRYAALDDLIEREVSKSSAVRVRARGTFRMRPEQGECRSVFGDIEVEWEAVS